MNKKLLMGIGVLALIGVMYFMFGGSTGNVVSAEMIDSGDSIKIPVAGITGDELGEDGPDGYASAQVVIEN